MKPFAKRKDPKLAALLSLLFGGGGQIYCGKTALGIVLILIDIVLWFSIVGGVFFSLLSAIHAKNLAEGISIKIDFVETAEKYYKLLKTEIYSSEEYSEKKESLISTLASKKLRCPPEEFLYAIIPLKEKKILLSGDIKKIKKLIL